jgi:hypothetical protein
MDFDWMNEEKTSQLKILDNFIKVKWAFFPFLCGNRIWRDKKKQKKHLVSYLVYFELKMDESGHGYYV